MSSCRSYNAHIAALLPGNMVDVTDSNLDPTFQGVTPEQAVGWLEMEGDPMLTLQVAVWRDPRFSGFQMGFIYQMWTLVRGFTLIKFN